jgi:ribulose 1,5-bisphosphate carboxylase large subunit-like protein
MSIEVTYDNWSASEGKSERELKSLIKRDISWGTHITNLHAAEEACAGDAKERWLQAEPEINNLDSGRYEDERFCLEIPDQNFNIEAEGVDHFISTVAGDVILNHDFDSVRVKSFEIQNSKWASAFPDPNVGIDGLYNNIFDNTIQENNRPILAFSVKPRVGHTVDDLLSLYEQVANAGFDIVEDDERIVDPENCPFEDRVKKIGAVQSDYNTSYSPNITGDIETAKERVDIAADHNIQIVKFDVLVGGFETLRKLTKYIRTEYSGSIAITVYPDAYRAYRKLDREFILKMVRLCGGDIVYAGSPTWSRFEREEGEPREALEPIHAHHQLLSKPIQVDSEIKSTLPTITNNQHLSRAELVTTLFRQEYSGHNQYGFFVGGGLSGFPAPIGEAADIWKKCINHASSAGLSDYSHFDISEYDQEFRDLGWDPLDVEEVLD